MRRNLDRYNLSNFKVCYLIDKWISSERNRAIIKDRLINGLTFEKLAEKYELSVRQMKTIVYKGMERIVKHLDRP